MLSEKQLKRYADVLIWGLQTAKSRRIARNDIVLVRFDLAAVRLAEILFAKLLEAGAHPLMRLNPTAAMERDFYSLANSKQLIYIPPGEEDLFKRLNGSISILAPESMTHLAKIDPQKIARSVLSKKKLRDVLDKREAQKQFSWTLCMFPTAQLAKYARISQKAYSAQVARACFLNSAAPVIEWQNIYKLAQRIKRWLNRLPVTALQVISENVDLRISLGEKRRWVGISGRNIPSFEIFVSPDWRGTQGSFYADQPSYRSGNHVRGVRLKFRDGRLVKIAAEKGRSFVRRQLGMDEGAARIGERLDLPVLVESDRLEVRPAG